MPAKLVYIPSVLTANGYRVEKWPDGYSNARLTKVSEIEDKKHEPCRVHSLTEAEAELSIDELMKKYPPPPMTADSRDITKMRAKGLGRGRVDAS